MGLRRFTRPKRLVAEFLGTGLLLATVVGSGIMAEQLAGGNVALALLANAIATGAILTVLITIFGDISGAHFNPAVTIAFAIRGEIPLVLGLSYILVQIAGGLCGVILAHAMFELDIVQVSTHARSGAAQQLAEVVATFGLVATILGTLRVQPKAVGAMVGLYITAAYWFTASTSFANPAVTVARGFTNTFSGIEPTDIPGFILAQLIGAIIATYLFRWLEHADRQPQD